MENSRWPVMHRTFDVHPMRGEFPKTMSIRATLVTERYGGDCTAHRPRCVKPGRLTLPMAASGHAKAHYAKVGAP